MQRASSEKILRKTKSSKAQVTMGTLRANFGELGNGGADDAPIASSIYSEASSVRYFTTQSAVTHNLAATNGSVKSELREAERRAAREKAAKLERDLMAFGNEF